MNPDARRRLRLEWRQRSVTVRDALIAALLRRPPGLLVSVAELSAELGQDYRCLRALARAWPGYLLPDEDPPAPALVRLHPHLDPRLPRQSETRRAR